MEDVLSLYDQQAVVTLIFFLGFVGFGLWFNRSGWPWLTKYWERRQELQHSIEEKRLECEAESDRRWQETTERMSENFAKLTGELEGFRSTMSAVVGTLERAIIKVANGNNSGS